MSSSRVSPQVASYWLNSIAGSINPAPHLEGEHRCDVAIVGAGYAGLWTAYYLKQRQPDMDVALVEAEFAGRGAAGRNGGWCSFDLANLPALLRNGETRSRATQLLSHMVAAVDVVREEVERQPIDCDFHKGGMLHVATSAAQLDRALRTQGFLEDLNLGHVQQWLEPREMDARVRMANGRGGAFSPHCAVVHPARLARGLAAVVVGMGVRLFEGSPATAVAPGLVRTPHGRVAADRIVLATEGYTGSSPGLPRRRLLPMHSFMTVTEPLDESLFTQIGLADREAFGDYSWLVTYGQRTSDNRLAFGYGGRSYPDGRPRDHFSAGDRHFKLIQDILQRQFPPLAGTTYSQSWGGAMAMGRDQTPFVEYDPDTRTAWLGGFFGNGVAATNLGARAMADLLLGRVSELTELDLLVRKTASPLERYRRWERQPLAWAATAGTLRRLQRRDTAEANDR